MVPSHPMRTLCIDIGGSGLKAIVVDATGQPLADRVRVPTPEDATPDAVLAAIHGLIAELPAFDRASIGFPGVVIDGVTRGAHNLDAGWAGFPLTERFAADTGKPTRAANDAGIQGLGVIEGRGVELVLTLGTGMGFALFVDGLYVPNIEMAHHVFRNHTTYEQRVGDHARRKVGNRRWRRRVVAVITQLAPIFNYRSLYIGGGNAVHLKPELLPEGVRLVDNVAGLLGGIKLWR